MRIDGIELRLVKIPLVSPFRTSGWVDRDKVCLIISMESGGEVGFGECVASETPAYSYETTETAWHILKDFIIPNILGKDFSAIDHFVHLIQETGGFRIRGHNMAKASVEMAFWDLEAKLNGVSLSKSLGGTREKVPCGVSIGIQEGTSHLIRLIEGYLSEGYKRIKIKIKPGMDVGVVEEVRDSFPDIPLMVDANGAYTLADKERLKSLDKFSLMMIEQPLSFDDIVDHAELQRELKTPLCLDESIRSMEEARQAISLGSCRIINIKPGRVGGHYQARKIHDYCMKIGVPVWCGGMLETGIGRAHNVALASLPNFSLPGDISASKRYFREDIVEPPFELNRDGTLSVPKGPGIGVEIVHERLERFTLRKQSFAS